MSKVEVIGDATVYLGDSLEVWGDVGDFSCIVTDPPYGIGESAGKNKSRGKLAISKDYGNDSWDNKIVEPAVILKMVESCGTSVIFGGNYYPLPPSPCWLVWDKVNGGSDFADCELAWTNMNSAVRLIKFMWNGMLRDGGESRGDHPTQKPIAVMKWAISKIPKIDGPVFDPFMGSGTTGVACMELGHKFIGIEREQKYFDIACRRIEDAQRQGRMF